MIYNNFKLKAIVGDINWTDNTVTDIKIMLVTSDYTPDIDAHVYKSYVTN